MATRRPEYARIRLAFGASTYFRELPAASLDALAAAAELQRCSRGGHLHRAGDNADCLWLVIEGGLLVYYISAHKEPVPVAMIGSGSFYSVASLVEGAASVSECRAERDTVTARIPGPVLRAMMREDDALRDLVPRLLLQRFHAAMAFYADSVSASLPERLARRLLGQVLAQCHDLDCGELELRTSQSDLALMLGASRSKVNTELRRLEQEGVLRLGYRRLYVRDCHRLSEIAGENVRAL